jgi:hypothetical protein
MHRVLVICISAVLLLTPILPAQSDQAPVINVQQVCRGIAEQENYPSETGGPDLAMSPCTESEQEVRAQLVKVWSTFAAIDKDHCVREATTGGESSYTDLLTCLEMARDLRKMKIPDNPSYRIER